MHLNHSHEDPGGMGEPGLRPIAPAVAKAIRPKNTNAADPSAAFLCTNPSLPRSLLQHPVLQLLLAFDAVTRPRHSLQPFGIDLLAAVDALPEAALPDA